MQSNQGKETTATKGGAAKLSQPAFTSITKVFPTAKSLHKHLLQILPKGISNALLQGGDSQAYNSLLNDSMVVGTATASQVPLEPNVPTMRSTPSIREVLSNIVAQITRAANALQLSPREQNVLCLGYRRKAVNATAVMRNHIDIECYSINTIQTLLISPAWQLLLNRIGEEQLKALLELPVFVKSVNGSYLQVSGLAAGELAYKESQRKKESLSKKRPRTSVEETVVGAKKPLLTGATTLTRFRMLYNNRSTCWQGLPSNHSFLKKPAVELIEEIFPKEDFDDKVLQGLQTTLPALLATCQKKFAEYNFMKSLHKFHHLSATSTAAKKTAPQHNDDDKDTAIQQANKKKRTSTDSTLHIYFDDLYETPQQRGDNGNSKGKAKKRKRGCRSGQQVKARRQEQQHAATNKPLFNTQDSADISLQHANNPTATTSVGNKLLATMLRNVERDISGGHHSQDFITQESPASDPQLSDSAARSNSTTGCSKSPAMFASYTPQDFLLLTSTLSASTPHPPTIATNAGNGNGDDVFKASKSQRNRIRRKMKKMLLTKQKPASSKPADNHEAEDAAGNALFSTAHISTDMGRFHHVQRTFPTFPSAPELPLNRASKSSQNHNTDMIDPSRSKKELWTFCTPVSSVSEFLKSIVLHSFLFPQCTLWGRNNKHNEKVLLSHIESYVLLGRAETMTVSQLCQHFQLQHISWLQQVSVHANIQMKVFQYFLSWLFGQLLTSVLANFFYVTEVEGKGLEVFFFRKSIWFSMIRIHLNDFQEQFVPVVITEDNFAASDLSRATSSSSFTNNNNNNNNNYNNSYNTNKSNSSAVPATVAIHNPYITAANADNALTLQRSTSAPSSSSSGNKSVLFNEVSADGRSAGSAAPSLAELSKQVLQQVQTSAITPMSGQHQGMPSYLRRNAFIPPQHLSIPPAVSHPYTASSSSSTSAVPAINAASGGISYTQKPAIVPTTTAAAAVAATVLPKKKIHTSHVKSKQRLQLKNYLMKLPVVRFVPKKATIRAITNLRTKFNGGSSGQYPMSGVGFRRMLCNVIPNKASLPSTSSAYGNSSNQSVIFNEVITNSQLYNCLHVLKHVFDSHSEECSGFGVFGLDEIYRKLRSFQELVGRKHLATRNQNSTAMQEEAEPAFYIAAIDLEKCYDHVDTSLLYDLIKSTLSGKHSNSTGGSVANTQDTNAALSRTTSATSSSSASHTTGSMHYLQQLGASMSGSEFYQYLPVVGKLLEDAVIHKYSVTHAMSSMNRIVSKPLRHVCPSNDILSFKEAGEEIASNYRNSLVTDHVIYPKINATEILRLLRLHLFQHIVKLPVLAKGSNTATNSTTDTDTDTNNPVNNGNNSSKKSSRYCTQIRGIPQGSVLSPILCNFYYGYLENLLFHSLDEQAKLGLHTDSVIIRLMDDYLMISTKKSCVQHFLQTSCDALKHYGGRINPMKTKLNFATRLQIDGQSVDVQPTVSYQSGCKVMPWCGLLLNVDSLECYPDMSRILNRPLKHAVSMECHHIGSHFNRSIKSFFRMKCHAIFLDQAINSNTVIVRNLYDMFLVTALRTVTYLKRVRHAYGHGLRVDFVKKCIREGILFASRLIHIRTNRKISRKLKMHLGNDDDEEEDLDEEDEEEEDFGGDGVELDGQRVFAKPAATPLSYNRMKKAMEDEQRISHFGQCFISSTEAMAIGWYAFDIVFRASKLTYDHYHHLLKWLQLNRNQLFREVVTIAALFPADLRRDCEERILHNSNVNPRG